MISVAMSLERGDVIITGTPGGVSAARKPPVFMQPGDIFEVEIGGLGVLTNSVQGMNWSVSTLPIAISRIRPRVKEHRSCRSSLTEMFTQEEPCPCHILITNVSGSSLILESHSSASITRQSIFLMTFCRKNSRNSAGNLRTMRVSGLWSCRALYLISL
jgi:hypothetical protein